MALHKILTYPNPELLKPSHPVTVFDQKLAILIEDMLETMRDSNGIGLAAPQIGIHKNLIVMEIPVENDEEAVTQLILVNPHITHQEGHVAIEEGCLSLPEFFIEVDRAEIITLEAQNPQGEKVVFNATGLMAICIQHELDHLDGKLLVDYATKYARSRYRKDREAISKSLT